MSMNADQEQEALVASLAACWQEDGTPVQRYETHISRVIVAGAVAYKLKRPVRLDFLDFSSLAARARYCREGLRLNRRLAPDIYLDVVAVTGERGRPELNGQGAVLDHAVKMTSFRQECLWSHRAGAGLLTAREIDELADTLGRFHAHADVAPDDTSWGTAATVRAVEDENSGFLIAHLPPAHRRDLQIRMPQASGEEPRALDRLFTERKRDGHVRECHGDLHLANILTENGRVQVFDCIEFNDTMRWIDVMSDLAFIRMDLACHGLAGLAMRLLNRYLERTGDFGGLRVLGYYERQRALVRAKVALVKALQENPGNPLLPEDAVRYLAFGAGKAEDAGDVSAGNPPIIILHGYSGSGKSTLAAALAECAAAIVLRSDVERKRIVGMAPDDHREAGREETLYAQRMTELTYSRLLDLARDVSLAGYPVIVDASFLQRHRREQFCELAARLDAPFVILDVRASAATMRERLRRRQLLGTDPSDADLSVMLRQLVAHDDLTARERTHVLPVEFDADLDEGRLLRLCEAIVPELWKRERDPR